MRKIFTFLTLSVCAIGFAQIKYEKGYYITEGGQKNEVLIKNLDWKNNPVSFEIKTSSDDHSKTMHIAQVKEFGLYDGPRFLKETVMMDRSSTEISALSTESAPNFQEATIFLKPLVKGKATLYYYEQGNLIRYFYNVGNEHVKQLVQKSYLVKSPSGGDAVAVNNEFRNQLQNSLKCSGMDTAGVDNLSYRNADLTSYFIKYNQCADDTFVIQSTDTTESGFNLTVRPRVNFSSFKMGQYGDSVEGDFGTSTKFSGGLEAEYILPFNHGRWSLTAEISYLKYNGEFTRVWNPGKLYQTQELRTITYSVLDFALGPRYNVYLADNSKFFINAGVLAGMPLNAEINFEYSGTFKIAESISLYGGVGYKYNRFSAEARIQTPSDKLEENSSWHGTFNNASLILGYQLF